MNTNKYDLYVFDVDGTLYFQNKLRIIMATRLLKYYVCHPHMYKDLFIIKDFRALRDKAENTENLYEITADKNHVTKERVESVIKKWIYDNPLDAVKASADTALIDKISELQTQGKKVAIWSDYAAADKLETLGIKCEYVYTAEEERVGELKPSPKGLNLIMSDLGISPDKTLMIGDRDVKDGEAARRAGVDYIILSKSKSKRLNQYAF